MVLMHWVGLTETDKKCDMSHYLPQLEYATAMYIYPVLEEVEPRGDSCVDHAANATVIRMSSRIQFPYVKQLISVLSGSILGWDSRPPRNNQSRKRYTAWR